MLGEGSCSRVMVLPEDHKQQRRMFVAESGGRGPRVSGLQGVMRCVLL